MADDKPIRLTKAQRSKLFDCHVGVGVVAYKMADRQLSEFEFYIDRKNQMRFVGNGAPVRFEIERDEDGFETSAKIVEYDAEMQARADILNRAVEHRKRLFPDDIGNGWIDSIDRLAGEVERLRTEVREQDALLKKVLDNLIQKFPLGAKFSVAWAGNLMRELGKRFNVEVD